MWISRLVCLFIIYSIMGWIFETFYCTVTSGKWRNRGFLYGPVCPIYGVGALLLSLLSRIAGTYSFVYEPWQVFLVSAAGASVLEYYTSLILEKLFHAMWWDYSKLPFNIQGRTSLFTSLGFGVAGLVIIYAIMPFTENGVGRITPLAAEFTALILVFMLAVDITLTVTALLHFDRVVRRMEENFDQNMDSLVNNAVSRANHIRQEVTERKNYADAQMRSLSAFAKMTVRRIHTFRDKDEETETFRNQLLSAVKRLKENRPGSGYSED